MSYFRYFIKNYTLIAKSLSDVLKKDVEFRMDKEILVSLQPS